MAQFYAENKRYLNIAIYAVVALLVIVWLQPLVAEKNPNRIIQVTISGLLLGGIYATIALGIVVINKSSGVFNFAHGGMMMIAGYLFFSFFNTAQVSPIVAVLLASATVILVIGARGFKELLVPTNLMIGGIAIALLTLAMTVGGLELRWLHAFVGATCGSVLIGLLVEHFAIRPLIGQPIFTAVMVTLALGEILSGLTKLIWGAQPRNLLIFAEESPWSPGQLVRLQSITIDTSASLGGNIIIDQPRLYGFIMAIIAFALFWLFFRFTTVGLAMRAISENQQLAESVGLRVRGILAITWAVAAVLAGAAGILYAGSSASSSIDTNLQFIALRVFPAVILGGLESISGALIGGLILGLTEEWAKLLFTGDVAEQLAPYIVLMIILVIRPEGLFGEKRIERI